MDCPVCTKPLVAVERDGVELDWCLACRGLWFDRGELGLLAEKTGRSLTFEEIVRGAGDKVSEKLRRCPRCNRKMNKVFLGGDDLVLVDRCPEHGLWMDQGELGKIMSQIPPTSDDPKWAVVRFLGETFQQAAPRKERKENHAPPRGGGNE
jgi:Zn-finger nucleic acid-binding protein